MRKHTRYAAFGAFFFILCCFSVQIIFAQDEEKDKTVNSSGEIVLQLTTQPAAKLGFTQSFTFSFLQGDSPLTDGNNISLALTAEISPVSLNGLFSAVWTPIAFFQLTAGGRIGSGWNVGDFYGIGLNYGNEDGKAEHSGSSFDGMLWNIRTGGTLQFDLAAVFPGDWHHVVARSYHEINYAGYTRAEKYQSWYFENDFGENVNGFNYYACNVIGYQMPIFLDMAAFMVETHKYLYNTPDRSRWGDDKYLFIFSGILNFAIHEKFGITAVTQFETQRNFTDSNWEELYYRNRTLNKSKPYILEFYRVAAILTYKL
jgi:hypothetical protein